MNNTNNTTARPVKTFRAVTLANGSTKRRRFPVGTVAYAIISDNDGKWAEMLWSGSRSGAEGQLRKMQDWHTSPGTGNGSFPNARIIEVAS